ncbi:hypothetical protein J4402_03120 [Candidatus Pacearchaeota archaeon]|nr:hypothetical protein [Candidatus Pacearchaeota archaeon]
MLDDKTIERYCNSNCKGDHCLLKEFARHIGHSERTLAQMMCIDILKYEESSAQQRDIGWNTAMQIWVGRGHAQRFEELYHDDIEPRKLYEQVTRPQEITA